MKTSYATSYQDYMNHMMYAIGCSLCDARATSRHVKPLTDQSLDNSLEHLVD